MFVAETQRGICQLAFIDSQAAQREACARLQRRWPNAQLRVDERRARELALQIFTGRGDAPAIALQAAGSNFQIKVWQALLDLGRGELTSYARIASAVGKSGAARAAGNAVGANPIAWLIPCHHVLRGDGALGGYRWGVERKRSMLAWESLCAHRAG